MTAKELIEKLKEYDEDSIIRFIVNTPEDIYSTVDDYDTDIWGDKDEICIETIFR